MKSALKSVTDFSFFPVALDQVFATQTCHGREDPVQVATPEWKTYCFYLSEFSWTRFFQSKIMFHLRNWETETPLYTVWLGHASLGQWCISHKHQHLHQKAGGWLRKSEILLLLSQQQISHCKSFLFIHVVGFCLQLVSLWNLVIEGQSQVWEDWRWKCQGTSILLFNSSGAFITDCNHQITKMYRTTVWFRAMSALRRMRKERIKGRGKAVQIFHGKILKFLLWKNSIPHLFSCR